MLNYRYHTYAFHACRALYIANKLNSSSTYPLLELFFKNQVHYISHYNGLPFCSMYHFHMPIELCFIINVFYSNMGWVFD
jgi:hypothetical protein